MILSIIVAHDPNLVIGTDGELPWHYKEDLAYFRKTTYGSTVLMGRGVFEEIGEKPLPGRRNIVLTRSRRYDDVVTCSSIEEALDRIDVNSDSEVFILGGGEIYKQMLPIADRLYITEIHKVYSGDTYFPEYRDKIGSEWHEISRDDREELSFIRYHRKDS